MCDKIKRNLMMEYNAEEVYQRRKRQWLTYGRALLTIAILGLLTVALYLMSQNFNSKSASEPDQMSQVVDNVVNFENVEQINNKFNNNHDESINDVAIVHSKFTKNNQRTKRSNDAVQLNSEQFEDELLQNEIPKDNSENLKTFDKSHHRRQQPSNGVIHRHIDANGVYIFNGYKCFPISTSKPIKKLDFYRDRNRKGMCVSMILCVLMFISLLSVISLAIV